MGAAAKSQPGIPVFAVSATYFVSGSRSEKRYQFRTARKSPGLFAAIQGFIDLSGLKGQVKS
jgi:hypothetical protein